VLAANGSAAAPSISFASDTDNGLYLNDPNSLGIAAAGSENMRLSASDNWLKRDSLTIGSAGAFTIAAATGKLSFTGGNFLFGTTTNSSNGILQLSTNALATTSAYGIGFGTDISLYRMGAASLALTGTGNPGFYIQSSGGASQFRVLYNAGSAIHVESLTTLPLKFMINSAEALLLDSALKATFAGAVTTSSATLSGAGAIPITTSLVKYTSTGALQALTLANGVDGQRLTIVHDVDGGSGVLTPTTKTGFSTVTFTSAGDTVTLVYVTTRGWMVTGSYLATIAP
tara:strand:+ start:85 stop:942 length:858 start_codon:yes stop_codon:yes gene_type:complete